MKAKGMDMKAKGMDMNRTNFIQQYRIEINRGGYVWENKNLEKYLTNVVIPNINGEKTDIIWKPNDDASRLAWKALGGRGKPTMKGLREMAA